MSNSSDYAITTLSSSIKQRTFTSGAVVAPFGFGHRGVQNLRGTCQPYTAFPGGSNINFVRSDCVASGGGGSTTEWYTEIVSASNINNSSSMQVGSLYLEAQTYTTIGALFTDIKGGVGGSDAHVEFRRFTTGVSLLTLSNTSTAGPTWSYITGSDVVVSNADWYDIYISASGNPATASIRGVYYEV